MADENQANEGAAAVQTITIQGFEFEVPAPYAAGHTLNDNEASALNQLFGENVRNNAAGRIKAAKEKSPDSFDIDAKTGENGDGPSLREQINEYAANYAFGARVARKAEPVDPVEREARRIAADAVREALKRQNVKVKDVGAEKFDAMVDTYAKNEKIVAEAKRRVKARENIGLEELGIDLSGATEGGEASEGGEG